MKTYLTLVSIFIYIGAYSQSINVNATIANGTSYALANDYLVPDPVDGPLIWDDETCAFNSFTPGLFGNDYGAVCFLHAKEEGQQPHHHEVSSYVGNRAFINGNNSSLVWIKWKNTGANYARTDGHYAEIHTELECTVSMEVTGIQPGESVTIYYWYDVFGGGTTSHEDNMNEEDSIRVINTLSVNGVQQFNNNQFDFQSPLGLPGWNEWKNKTGTFKVSFGQDFLFELTSDILLYLNNPPDTGGYGYGVDENHGIFKGIIYFSLQQEYPVYYDPTQIQPLYSLDIGSDSEISDPQQDGNENFDPGDIYPQTTVPAISPWIDDASIFGGDPDPQTSFPFNPAPVGSGQAPDIVSPVYFDLDGCDLLATALSGLSFGPGDPSISWFADSCLFEAEYIYLSFDDDSPEHYVSVVPPSAPVNSNSPGMNTIYSLAGAKNEVIEYLYGAIPTSSYSFFNPTYAESSLHPYLSPDPAANNAADDDIDALDVIPVSGNNSPCSHYYFSADHEATYNFPLLPPPHLLDPAIIYEIGINGPVPVIDHNHHGLPPGTDIDAFEFAWVWDYNEGRYGLALLFSVDDDDTLTVSDESGGLNPGMIYFSFLNGVHQVFSASQHSDDIDGMAVWQASLNGTPPFPNPVWGTKTWTGSMNDQWHDPLNWFPQGTPFHPEDVFIPPISPSPTITNSGLDCKSIDIGTGAQVRLESGVTFTVKGP